ncbi:MAG TPA: hypothetical protein VE944_29540 [Nostoc sp.]|uniref:hypothetical protein n=1 Tax=Nostoc sp. TaxID=1180 RepID=UPI002D3CCA8B|nr:hypothetical protein [Nostoc sp.]HYX18434.1 hypothetical protein [Nostoc sp.]
MRLPIGNCFETINYELSITLNTEAIAANVDHGTWRFLLGYLLKTVGLSEFAFAPIVRRYGLENNCDAAKAVDKQRITQY